MALLLRVGNLGAIHREGGQPINNGDEQSHFRTQITVADTKHRVGIAPRLVGFTWGEESADDALLQWQTNHLSRDTTDDSNANLEAATPSRNVPHGRETNPARREQGPRQGLGKPVRVSTISTLGASAELPPGYATPPTYVGFVRTGRQRRDDESRLDDEKEKKEQDMDEIPAESGIIGVWLVVNADKKAVAV